jgi:protocatechuate 3,4-dioxygenase beta subunit
VGGLTGDWQAVGTNARVFVTAYVRDSNNQPVEGATVMGEWTGANGDTSCVTGSDGSCRFETKPVPRPGSVTFSVTDIEHGTLTYDPTQNQRTSITVTF